MIEDARKNNVHKGHEAAFTIAESSEEASTALTVVESQAMAEIVIGSPTLHMDRVFATGAIRGGEESQVPRTLSWCTGNNPMFNKDGKQPLEQARGWFIDKPDEDEMFPDDYELMDAMEFLCDQGKAREVVVEHRDKDDKPNRVPSWQLYDVSLFLVCKEILSKQAMESDNSDRWGLAYVGWRKDTHSKLKGHCFIKGLMDAGYNGMFAFSFSSFLTPKILAALNAQHYVLRFVNDLRARMGDDTPLPPYAFALPIHCSAKTITAKSSETGKSKELYYPIPGIPRLSERNPEEAKNYLVSVMITDNQQTVLEYDGRVDQMATWSIRETSRWLAGKDDQDNGIVPAGRDDPEAVKDDRPF